MDFKDTQAIYLQIADLVCDYIIGGKWTEGERIPSVRELGIQLEVNPNTVMRAYEVLQAREVIRNKRGIGFFVAENAVEQIQHQRRKEFIHQVLPDVFRRMKLLGISLEELAAAYEKYNESNNS